MNASTPQGKPAKAATAPAFKDWCARQLASVEAALSDWVGAQAPERLRQAMRYAVLDGGKRLRPLLVLAASEAAAGHPPAALRAACAIELIHAYSLVHDDMPCMDNDVLRRGKPTVHVQFGQADALLAGDALQTLAFEVLTAELPTFAPFDSAIASQLIAIFAPRARRMVSGQMLDLNAEASANISQSDLEAIHRDKTGALIEAAMLMGGICAGATAPQRMALQECAQHIGLAFQVQDDILDVTTSTDTLGKPAGSDEKLDKSTYVKLMGVENATSYAQSLFNDGRTAIIREMSRHESSSSELGNDANNDALLALIEWLWARKK